MPHESILIRLISEMLDDAYAAIEALGCIQVRKNDKSFDLSTISACLEQKGLPYLTRELPLLDDFLVAIMTARPLPKLTGFKTNVSEGGKAYPRLFRPFWVCLLDPQSPIHQSDCIRLLRTILLGFKKLDVPFTQEQELQKLRDFLSIEEELENVDVSMFPNDLSFRINRISEFFFEDVDPKTKKRYDWLPECLRPGHGPGAVAGRERGDEKWNFSTYYTTLHAEWPIYEIMYGLRSVSHDTYTQRARSLPMQLLEDVSKIRAMPRSDEPTSRLFFVPKDSKGPRIIACEPKELMFVEQGVSRDLMKRFERHPMTAGHVNFTDQSINQGFALMGSISGEWATLDLSDASDRVSLPLVNLAFPRVLARKLMALRATHTELPDGRKVKLRKFATMGNALCFPVESWCFYVICVAAIDAICNDMVEATGSVYVYGDDIIVRQKYAEHVIASLEKFALKVNISKSYWNPRLSETLGTFRESCGMDAYNATNVTPFRIRKVPARRPSDTASIVSWVDLATRMRPQMPRSAAFIKSYVESVIRRRIPVVPFPHDFLSVVWPGEEDHNRDFPSATWCDAKCYYQSSELVPVPRKRYSELDGWSGVLRSLLGSVEHKYTDVVDRQSTLKMRKVSLRHLSW